MRYTVDLAVSTVEITQRNVHWSTL